MSLGNPNAVNPRKPRRVAIVLSNPAVSTTTGWPVGLPVELSAAATGT